MKLLRWLAFLLLLGSSPAFAGYCSGTPTGGDSMQQQDVANCVKLPGTFTFATLPNATGVKVGTTAYTSDQGEVVKTATGWAAVTSSGPLPSIAGNNILCNNTTGVLAPAACANLPVGAGTALWRTPQQYGAKCDGTTDDAVALQNWLNASSFQTPGFMPPVTCAYHTALVWPVSDTYIFGANPLFFNAYNQSTLKPVGVRGMTMDGSLYPGNGSYSPRHWIKDISFDLTSATDSTAAAYISNVYTVHLDNVTFNNCPTGIPVCVLAGGGTNASFDVSLDHVRIYGPAGGMGTTTGLKVTNIAAKLYDPDIEGFAGTGGIGFLDTGNFVYVDIFSPYMEGNLVDVSHQLTFNGQVNIFGGTIQPLMTGATSIQLGGGNFGCYGVGIQYVASTVVPITYQARGLTGIQIHSCSGQYTGHTFITAASDLSGSDIWPASANGFGPTGATWGTPTVLPPSGSFGNNGVLTLGTATPVTLPNAWMYFPAGAIFSGSAAGLYYTQCTTATACVVFNNTLASGLPYNISSPTAFTGKTGPGAYTQTTSTNILLVNIPVHGGSMGPGGSLTIDLKLGRNADSNAVLISPYLGTSQIGEVYPTFSGAANGGVVGYHQILQNLGVQNSQVMALVGNGYYTDQQATPAQYSTIDTSGDLNFQIQANSPAATTTSIVWGGTLKTIFAE